MLTLINDIILGGKARGFFNAKLRKATQNLTSLQKCLEVFLRRGKNLTSSLGRLSRRTCLQVFLMFLSIHLRSYQNFRYPGSKGGNDGQLIQFKGFH